MFATPQGSQSHDRIVSLATDACLADLDAIDAYDAALDRIEDAGMVRVLRGCLEDHQRHLVELSELLVSVDAQLPMQGIIDHLLCTARMLVGNLGGDGGVLLALRSREAEAWATYERLAKSTGLPPEVRELLRRHAREERRHLGLVEHHANSADASGVVVSSLASSFWP